MALRLFAPYFIKGNARAKIVAAKSFPTGARKTALITGKVSLIPLHAANSVRGELGMGLARHRCTNTSPVLGHEH
jgi:hypothetical protein